MKSRTALVGLALTLLAAPGWAVCRPLADTGERGALRALEDPALTSLRAGAVTLRPSIAETERSALRSAEAASTELAALRGGDVNLTDRDLTLIAIGVAVVLLIVIIA